MSGIRDRDMERTISDGFERAGCRAALHVVDLATESEVGVLPDAPVVLASVFKVLVALEFYAQADAGTLNPTQIVELDPASRVAGPTGISRFSDPVQVSLRDLCLMMMSVSDNAATDVLLRLVGLDAVNARALACGCASTVVTSCAADLLDGVAIDIGFATYAELLAAQSGAFGPEAQRKSTDQAAIDRCRALDPMRTTRSTARDMTRLLWAIWSDEAASSASCASVRSVMAQQVGGRLVRALPDGAFIAAKTGSLFGRVRNEIGVITHADGRAFAVAVFTRAHRPFERGVNIENEMAHAAATAISAFRPESV